MNSATNFTVLGNTFVGNTSYIGARGVNCTPTDETPNPEPAVVDANRVSESTLQPDFVSVPDADSLTCILPANGDFWPFGGMPVVKVPGEEEDSGSPSSSGTLSGGSSAGAKAGAGVGITLAILVVGIGAWFFRKWYLGRQSPKPYVRRADW